jgi:hypothetical protein
VKHVNRHSTTLAATLLLLGATAASNVAPPAAAAQPSSEEATAASHEREIRQRLQERQREIATRWRRFGDVEVDWDNWQQLDGQPQVWVSGWRRPLSKPLSTGGLNWPEAQPEPRNKDQPPDRGIAVDCDKLTLTRKRAGAHWGEWRVPKANSAAEELLVAVCTTVPELDR